MHKQELQNLPKLFKIDDKWIKELTSITYLIIIITDRGLKNPQTSMKFQLRISIETRLIII